MNQKEFYVKYYEYDEEYNLNAKFSFEEKEINKYCSLSWLGMVHAINPIMWEAKEGEFVNSGPAWSTQ